MFKPIFKRNVQGWKIPGRWAFAASELLSTESLNMLFKIRNNDHKIPIIVTTIMMK